MPSSFDTLIRELERICAPERIRRNVALAPYTTFGIGGPADVFVEVQSPDELFGVVQAARDQGISFFLLGLGANILVGDRGFRGLVIRNAARAFSVDDAGILTADSGAIVWPDAIRFTVDRGWSGLEHFAGIPSTMGGALWQNLHFLSPAPERERTIFLEEIFLDADLLTLTGKEIVRGADYFAFGYDTSVLHSSGDIVLSARFQLQKADPDTMRRTIEENLGWRADRHPPLDTEPSAGSIFKKIEGIGAGRLIDGCGLKGIRIGGAQITHRHANIMINAGGATAADVRRLIDHVVETVQHETGFRLEPEISFVGEFV